MFKNRYITEAAAEPTDASYNHFGKLAKLMNSMCNNQQLLIDSNSYLPTVSKSDSSVKCFTNEPCEIIYKVLEITCGRI